MQSRQLDSTTPNGTTTASVSVSSWCHSGERHGCRKNSAIALKPSCSFGSLIVCMVLLISSVEATSDQSLENPALSSGDASGEGDVLRVPSVLEGINSAWRRKSQQLHDISDRYMADGSNLLFGNIAFPETNALQKRWDAKDAPQGTNFSQWKVIKQELCFTDYQPVTGCLANLQGDGIFSQNWTEDLGVTLDQNFDLKTAQAAAESQFQVSVTQYYSEGLEIKFAIPGGTVGQVFARKHMVQQDQQYRECVRTNSSQDGLECSEWSEPIHGVLPISSELLELQGRLGLSNLEC